MRCDRTGNTCGTDTWALGHECPCEPCALYLAVEAVRRRQALVIAQRQLGAGWRPESEPYHMPKWLIGTSLGDTEWS